MKLKDKVQLRRVRAEEIGELKDKTVNIARVAKVVKGGRRFGFSALVVSGDGRGHVGFGLGKAAEVPDALRKASESARKNLIKVPIVGTTIPHDMIGKSGPTSVIMKPAAAGTGVIAGSAVRAIIEASGLRDIRTKVIGSSNSHNVVHAVFEGLLSLREPATIAGLRGKGQEELGYKPY